MPTNKTAFLQVTIEYHVLGALDGITPAPPISLDPTSPLFVDADERGIRVVPVEGGLGLIDPDLLVGGTQGDRCIPWIYLDANGLAGDPAAQFSVVDVEPEPGIDVPAGQIAPRFLTGGVPTFFSRKGTLVPQGSNIGVFGYRAGLEKIVRINIVAPRDSLEWAAIQEACCCSDQPCPDLPEITSASITDYTVGTSVDFTVTGSNLGVGGALRFAPLDYFLVDGDSNGFIPLQIVSQVTKNSVVLRLFTTDAPEGTYTTIARNPFDQDCSNAAQTPPVTISVTNVVVCPDVGAVSGDTIVADGSSNNEITLTGENFGSAMNPNVADVTLTGPGGSLTVDSITIVSDTSIDVVFDADAGTGTYALTVFPTNAACDPVVFPSVVTVTP